jgi:hypothetical protein
VNTQESVLPSMRMFGCIKAHTAVRKSSVSTSTLTRRKSPLSFFLFFLSPSFPQLYFLPFSLVPWPKARSLLYETSELVARPQNYSRARFRWVYTASKGLQRKRAKSVRKFLLFFFFFFLLLDELTPPRAPFENTENEMSTWLKPLCMRTKETQLLLTNASQRPWTSLPKLLTRSSK